MNNLDEKNTSNEKHTHDEGSSKEESDSESDVDEEYECIVCKQYFLGEDRLEQHRKIHQHWG